MVGRICPTIKSYSAPVVVVVSDAAIAGLVPDDALAETVFVSVSDCDEAQRFFESEYPLINTDIEERYRTLVYNQEVSTKTKDISAASEGVLRLGLIVVLFCLGLLFNVLYAFRFATQFVSLRRRDFQTLRLLGSSFSAVSFSVAVVLGFELLSAELVADALCKGVLMLIAGFEYSMMEHAAFVAPFGLLLIITVALGSVLSVCRYTGLEK